MEIKDFIDNYLKWLKSEIKVQKIGEFYEITTPFLDPDNDAIQIYIKFDGKRVYFSDDGYTLHRLEAMGITFKGQRKKQLNDIILQYGVRQHGFELTAECSENDSPQKKHTFIQAILRINDLYVTSRNRVQSLFIDDINDYFDKNEIYCAPNIQLSGKSGFSHSYDFLIQRSKNKPERIVKALNIANQTNMGSILFSWEDTKTARPYESKLIVIVNDRNKVQDGVLDGFRNYDVTTILWSLKDEHENLNILSA